MLIKRISALLSVFLVALIILTGYGSNSKSTNDLESIMKEDNYIIVDVRTKEEYERLHIKEAINIPYDEINESIELDNSKKILVYCQSGNRSQKSYISLTNLGYDVYNLGGINDIDLLKE